MEKNNGNLGMCQPVKKMHNGIEISVDPRMELISILELITKDYQTTWKGTLSLEEFEYKSDVLDYFGKFENHRVIEVFKTMSLKEFDAENPPFSYGAPSKTMLYLEEDFTLNQAFYLDDFMMTRVGGKASVDNFIHELKEFYRLSNFELFYKKHQSYYKQIISNTQRAIGNRNYIKQLEEFYGTRQKSYNIILVTLYRGCYGHSLMSQEEGMHIFSLVCVLDKAKDISSKAEKFYNNLLTHEFSHSFVNPISHKYLDVINQYKSDEIINEVKAKSTYIDWYDIVNEYLIRAITILLNDPEYAGHCCVVENEMNMGFKRIQKVLDEIKIYIDQRENYKTFEAFYLDVLGRYKKNKQSM